MEDQFKEVELEAPVSEGQLHCAFVAITAWVPLYEHYEDDSMSEERRNALYPVVVMQSRWDGHMGFVGGKVDKLDRGDPKRAIVREAAEEVNFPVDYESLVHVVSHESETMRLDCFRIDLGINTMQDLQWFLEDAAQASQTICEGTTVIAHLCDYGSNRGWHNLRNSNVLSSAVGLELDKIRALLLADIPERGIIAY